MRSLRIGLTAGKVHMWYFRRHDISVEYLGLKDRGRGCSSEEPFQPMWLDLGAA